MQNTIRLAAIDLGSNSFRLEVGQMEAGQYQRTDYLKETVRQGSGLDAEDNLTPEAMDRGWDCLARFSERLSGFSPSNVCAVATQTLREARNREVFLVRANELLGFPIKVISGLEEARLIYQGVAHALPQGDERRLVIDIGGRSTELILGQGLKPTLMATFQLGSIAWSKRYFSDNLFSKQTFERSEKAAKTVLAEAIEVYGRSSWDMAYGSAGTVGAVGDVLFAAGWPAGIINLDGLDWLKDMLIRAKNAEQIQLAGMKDDRRPMIGGGLSILRGIFDMLQIDQMHIATGGLRHGLLCDLMRSRL
jgi:exopolyphosphatase/guanosine-5'-triphosphate,3'-diphosphate pyrophosphatase